MLHSRRIISHICLVAVVGMVALAGVILSPAREVESDATITFTYLSGHVGGDFFLDATTATAFGYTSTGEGYCVLGGLSSSPLGRIKFSADGGVNYYNSLYASLIDRSSGNDCDRSLLAQGVSTGTASITVSLNGNDQGYDDDDDDGYKSVTGYLVALSSSFHVSSISTSSVSYFSATSSVSVLGKTATPGSVNLRYRAQGGSAWTTSSAQDIASGASADFSLTSLLPNTTYEVEGYLTTNPTFLPQTATFTTRTVLDPSITLAAPDITYHDATITATLTDNVNDGVTNATVLYLRYRRDGETDWSPILQQPIVEGGASFALTGLKHGSRYTVEVNISNQFSTARTQATFSTLSLIAVLEPAPNDFILNDTGGASFSLGLAVDSGFATCHAEISSSSPVPGRLEWSTDGSKWTSVGEGADCFSPTTAVTGNTVILYLRGKTEGAYRLGIRSGGITLWYLGSVVDPVYDSRNIFTGVRPQIETDSVKTVDGNPRVLDITIFWSSVDETDGYQVRLTM